MKISRNAGAGTFKFKDVFFGFQKLNAVKEIFGDATPQILEELKVEIFPRQGYMGVSDEDGHVFASKHYLESGEYWSVYLDAVHELVHVRQFMEHKELFDERYAYGDRPTEIEAYQVTTKEARRIGLSEKEIFEYLKVPWMSNAEHLRLAKACGVPLDRVAPPKKRASDKK